MRKIVNLYLFRFGSLLVLEGFSNGIFVILLLGCAKLMMPFIFNDCPAQTSEDVLLGSKPRLLDTPNSVQSALRVFKVFCWLYS